MRQDVGTWRNGSLTARPPKGDGALDPTDPANQVSMYIMNRHGVVHRVPRWLGVDRLTDPISVMRGMREATEEEYIESEKRLLEEAPEPKSPPPISPQKDEEDRITKLEEKMDKIMDILLEKNNKKEEG